MYADLAGTLIQIVEAAMPPPGTAEGIAVTSAEIELPLEVTVARRADGRPAFLARAPHSRWQAGMLPSVHRARIVVEREEA
jgi:hypothetical protein